MTQSIRTAIMVITGFVCLMAWYKWNHPRLNAMERKGREGEKKLSKTLKEIDKNGRILRNLYFFYKNSSSEIDLVFIHSSGIYVFESKNYSWYVYGEFDEPEWTYDCVINKRKFYNPVWQNRKHTNEIKDFLEKNGHGGIPIYSVVVFSNEADVYMRNYRKDNSYVCRQGDLRQYIHNNEKRTPKQDRLNKELINQLYFKLKPLTKVSAWKKRKHIRYVRKISMTHDGQNANG